MQMHNPSRLAPVCRAKTQSGQFPCAEISQRSLLRIPEQEGNSQDQLPLRGIPHWIVENPSQLKIRPESYVLVEENAKADIQTNGVSHLAEAATGSQRSSAGCL